MRAAGQDERGTVGGASHGIRALVAAPAGHGKSADDYVLYLPRF